RRARGGLPCRWRGRAAARRRQTRRAPAVPVEADPASPAGARGAVRADLPGADHHPRRAVSSLNDLDDKVTLMSSPPRVVPFVLDGYGERPDKQGNAIRLARTPNFDRLYREYPWTLIGASGNDVGLPDGQMGNSEVGHLNLGAGRIVYQDIVRIDKAIRD